jgi:hypothetical protein
VSNSSYSQYPILKKLGGDSVVIITLEQANKINDSYKNKEFKIFSLRDSLSKQKTRIDLESTYSKYIQSEFIKNASLNSESNIQYYEERERMWEDKVKKQVRTNVYIFISMMFLFLLKS